MQDPLTVGGGQLGELIRATDWRTTRLGPRDRWPHALKTALRNLLDSRQPMSLHWGPDLLGLYNDGFLPLLGEKHPHALGEPMRETWADAWPVVGADLERVATLGHAVLYDEALVPVIRNGVLEDAWWNYSYSPVFGDDGELAGLLVIATEVTTGVRSRMQLERATREAELARRELHGVFMQTPLPMAILHGPNHRFTFANDPYVKFTGREVLGMPLIGAFSVEEAGHYIPHLDRVLQTGEPSVIRESALMLPDERGVPTQHYIDVGYYPHLDPDGRPVGVLALIVDITEQVAARKISEQAREVAETANHAKDEFLATVSHELRTPLMAILGWASMLRTAPDPQRIARGLEVIERNAHAQAKLVEDILDVSRIISGKMRLAFGRVKMAAAVSAALETVRPAAEARGIDISVEMSDHELTLLGDPDRLQQIVWNLLSNAVKFSSKAGTVHVRVFQDNSEIHLHVRDTGKGISPAFLPYVFDRFRQDDASTTKQHAGLGLGLAIVRTLVELHGGKVSAHSDGDGRGALFSAVFPISAVDQPSSPEPAPSATNRARARLGGALEGVHALVVDDQDDARELVATVLEDAGARVSQASSAQRALELLAIASDVTVLVSDVGMPGEDGYSLVARVRSAASTLPALALTAFARTEDRQRALAAGFQEHLAKPIEAARLVAAVARLVRR